MGRIHDHCFTSGRPALQVGSAGASLAWIRGSFIAGRARRPQPSQATAPAQPSREPRPARRRRVLHRRCARRRRLRHTARARAGRCASPKPRRARSWWTRRTPASCSATSAARVLRWQLKGYTDAQGRDGRPGALGPAARAAAPVLARGGRYGPDPRGSSRPSIVCPATPGPRGRADAAARGGVRVRGRRRSRRRRRRCSSSRSGTSCG